MRVYKGQRMIVLDGPEGVLRTIPMGLGFAPEGHKQFEGDGRTPEGSYVIDRRNPESLFHLSIGISYPNEADIAYAKAQGRSPGGDIFIHGGRALALTRQTSATGRPDALPFRIGR